MLIIWWGLSYIHRGLESWQAFGQKHADCGYPPLLTIDVDPVLRGFYVKQQPGLTAEVYARKELEFTAKALKSMTCPSCGFVVQLHPLDWTAIDSPAAQPQPDEGRP